MYVDACALVAILSGELEAEAYSRAIDEAAAPWTSAIAVFEAVLVLSRPHKLGLGLETVHVIVLDYLGELEIKRKEMGRPEDVLLHAVRVAVLHGVSRKKLSAFDCFHYAAAKATGSSMLTLDRLLRETDVETLP